jgi:endonuclease YncB( thermonuclease family)
VSAREQWTYPYATLARVIDGDSFVADVRCGMDFGFHVYIAGSSRQRFRLNRCAAAPAKTESGDGARARLAELLAEPFVLVSVGPYKYGDAWMAEVVLDDGRNVSDVMVQEQWAASWNGSGKQPLPPWPRTVST